MTQIIVPQHDPLPGVEPTMMRPDWSKYHKAFLKAIIHSNAELDRLNVVIDPMIDAETAKKNESVGVFSSSFAGFKLTLNWMPTKHGSIPPRHIAVECLGEVVGIIGPYMHIRKCWRCDLEGYRDPACRHPWVVPFERCPRCGELDWWGRVCTPDDVLDRAAELIARDANYDQFWSLFDGDGAQIRNRKRKGGAN